MNCTPPTLAEPGLDPALVPPSRAYVFLEGFERLPILIDDGVHWASLDEAAKLLGVPVPEITGQVDWSAEVPVAMRSHLNPPTIRCIVEGGIDKDYVNLEALLPHFLRARGSKKLLLSLLRVAMGTGSYVLPPGLGEQVSPIKFVTDSGLFIPQVYYSSTWGEIRSFVSGTTVWMAAASIAKILGISVKSVLQLAGGHTLTIRGNRIHNSIDPGGREVYIRSEAACRVLEGGTHFDSFVMQVREWIQDELLNPTRLLKAGAVISIQALYKALHSDTPNIYFGVGMEEMMEEIRTDFHYPISAWDGVVPVTIARDFAKNKEGYGAQVVARLLRDGGFRCGGSVGETADAALARLHDLFPDENGMVSALALDDFLCGSPGPAGLSHSDQYYANVEATKNKLRKRGELFVSAYHAYELIGPR